MALTDMAAWVRIAGQKINELARAIWQKTREAEA
jgi:hypothetical protein